MPELAEHREIGGHGVVVKEASDHLRQPSPLFGDRPVHLPPQLLLDLLEFGPHTVAPGFPLEQKCAPAAAAADMGEPQEIESFRFTKPAPFAVELRFRDRMYSCQPRIRRDRPIPDHDPSIRERSCLRRVQS